jgi:Flp pilus assembly protein TadG
MQKRNSKGSQLAELPAAIILLLLGIAFPLIIMASMFYKVYMFQAIIKDGAQIGSQQQDFTTASSVASTYLTTHRPAGVTVAAPTVTLIQRNITYNTGSPATPHTYAAYFLQVTSTGSLSPLVQMGSFFGMQIPGLTGPFTLQATQAVYFENQTAAAAHAAGGP